ncbi:MAG: hypothetical protein ACE5G2_08250 [Candidatus Krumholzibacteriia bacterium]
MQAWPALVALVCTALAALPVRAATPGEVLRRYLDARMRGDVQAARALWDSRDLRRSKAMGTRYAGLEARFDDYWLLSAEECAAVAAEARPVVRDSVVEDEWARFSVVLESRTSGDPIDTLSYVVRSANGSWRVSLPYEKATVAWTRREGRFFKVRSKKLVLVNGQAIAAMDRAIVEILERLGAPPTSQLRLERVKLEYYLCENDDDIRMLVGSVDREGYLPAGERIVTRALPDMNSVARALVNLTLRRTPHRSVAVLEEGLAAALGGTRELSGEVLLQRARNSLALDASAFESPLDPDMFDHPGVVPMAALWCMGLLEDLGPSRFFELYRELAGTSSQVQARSAADIRAAIEKATGKSGDALFEAVRAKLGALDPPLRAGCTSWPFETRGMQPVLRWRDGEEMWALQAFETGDDYTMTIAPYEPGPPRWVRRFTDSLAVAHGREPAYADDEPEPVSRPSGDPPEIVLLVRERLDQEPEPFESPLFASHFASRLYAQELYGLFVNPDGAWLYDYRRGILIAEFSADTSPPGHPTFYDEELGRICFRFRRDLFAKQLAAYYVTVFIYTGE